MEKELNDFELIENNLRGKLSDSEKKEFENRLMTDEELKNLLGDYILITQGIRSSGRTKLKNAMEQWEKELPEIKIKPSKPSKKNYLVMMAATVVIFISALAGWYFIQNKSLTGNELYMAYFEPYTNIADPTLRGEMDADGPLRKAYRLYDSKNYGQSEVELEKLFKQTGEPIHQFYLAMSQMANGKPEAGKKNLQQCLNKLPVLEPQIKWYLALASIKLEQKEDALKWLNQLSKSDTSYAPKADKLLKQIQ